MTLKRGVRVEMNQSAAGPSSVPEVKLQDSEAAPPKSLVQAGSVPENKPVPSAPTAPVGITSQPINIKKVAKKGKRKR